MSAHLDRDEIAGLAMLSPSDPERAGADAHARECAACRGALEEASATLAALDALAPPPAPSADVLARAKRAVLEEMSGDAARHTPEPELSATKRGARARAALAIPAVSIAAFVALALVLRPITDVAWPIALGVLAIVGGRTALALARGTARGEGFSLALGVGASLVLVMVDVGGEADAHGMKCVAVELAAAALPLICATVLAWRGALRPSALGFAAVAASGALAGQLALRATCPDHGLDHLAAFHFGGVVAAAMAGAILSRLPALRAARDA